MTEVTTRARPIIAAYDGSPASNEALRWAAREAQARGTELQILHVQAPLPAEIVGFDPSAGLAFGEWERSGQLLLASAEALAQASAPGVRVTTRLEYEAVTPALLEASASGAAMLVMGSRGRGGFTGLLLGSISTQVTAHASCPVVVIHDPEQRFYEGEPTEFANRVVLGIDGSELSRDAMAFAFDFASRHGLGVTALHTWDVPVPDTVPPIIVTQDEIDEVQDEELAITATQLATWTDKHPEVDVAQKVVRGSAEAVLVNAAKDSALVVVGSRGRGGFLGLVLGSVSQALLHHAAAPIAVVRPSQ
jgi:nucleotide-binding universal stress UspA family protein